MKILILCLLLAFSAIAQTPVGLPVYVAAGGAYSQFVGANLWISGIVPLSSSKGLYESTTMDLFPVKTTVGGKTGYILQASFREGIHKVLHQDPNNVVLLGADGGFSFAQASAAGSVKSGPSAAVTITYVRQLSDTWAVMVPFRGLYMPGGWIPVVEIGVVWKPSKQTPFHRHLKRILP